jgi:glycyl-tRNA synthetase (class II)
MPTLITDKVYSAKTAAYVYTLKDIRRWLIATDYKGDPFNWRKLSKIESAKYSHEMFDITIMVHFKKPEDLMLYLLTWSSEVLLNP